MIYLLCLYGENRYDNWKDIESLEELYKRTLYLDEENKNSEWEHCMSAFSETPIENKSNSNYKLLLDISFKLQSSDFTKITTKDRCIVSFLMSKPLDENVTWRIYARRKGKEFWV